MSFEDTLIEEDGFGFVPRPRSVTYTRKPREIVRRYTLTNKHKAVVRLISWGARIQSIKVPNRDGKLVDVVLGFDDIDGYMRNRFMGSIVGRVANRTSGGSMRLDNANDPLSINDTGTGKDHLNGGVVAFDNVNWQSQIVNNRVVMSRLSRANGEGHPGDVLTQAKYTWTDDNQLHINIRATATKPTPVDIANYCLFNLAGHGAGARELRKHVLTVNADHWTVTSVGSNLPTGVISPVDRTAFELRLPARLDQRRLYDVPGGGYNHNLCVNSPSYWCYRFHARILHPTSGRFMEIYSNHPGLRVYTGNDLPPRPAERVCPPDLKEREWEGSCEGVPIDPLESLSGVLSYYFEQTKEVAGLGGAREIYGKGGVPYRRHGGFALSPQNYPDAVNYEHFPSCVLRPGKVYVHDMTYKFGVALSARKTR